MKYIAPFSAVANMLILIGVILVLYFAALDMPPIESRSLIAEYDKIPLFFCTVLFSMEGIGVVSVNSTNNESRNSIKLNLT